MIFPPRVEMEKLMPEFFRSRAGRQCLTIMALGAVLWISATLLDVDNWLVSFMSSFENYGADKFVLALGISWLGAIPFMLGVWPVPLFPFGPLLAALIVAAATGSTRSLLRRMLQWRASPKWYAFALITPFAITLGVAYINTVLGAP